MAALPQLKERSPVRCDRRMLDASTKRIHALRPVRVAGRLFLVTDRWLMLQLFMRCVPCVWQVWWGGASGIEIDLPLLIDAAFAAGSAMIAFGAVLGKATPTQMLWLTAFMIPIYAVS